MISKLPLSGKMPSGLVASVAANGLVHTGVLCGMRVDMYGSLNI